VRECRIDASASASTLSGAAPALERRWLRELPKLLLTAEEEDEELTAAAGADADADADAAVGMEIGADCEGDAWGGAPCAGGAWGVAA
jgi:hypothetical protein